MYKVNPAPDPAAMCMGLESLGIGLAASLPSTALFNTLRFHVNVMSSYVKLCQFESLYGEVTER